jgi:outer membrane protein assembly factor BamA
MTHIAHGFVLGISLFAASVALAQPARKKPVEYVGEVILVGNTVTQDHVIRRQSSIYPGQILDRSELRKMEQRLIELGLFKYDPAKKIGPTVKVLENQSPFKDVLVTVQEDTKMKMHFASGVDSTGSPIVRLVLEDRNFDLFGFPTSVEDIKQERAFRGAGQRVRFELVRLNILELRLVLFADGQLLPLAIRTICE